MQFTYTHTHAHAHLNRQQALHINERPPSVLAPATERWTPAVDVRGM